MKKTDYRDVWVYIEQGRRGVSAVSLELCCRLRGLCDEMGERLAAVVMEPVPEGLIAELADCGVERVIRVGGSGHEEYSSEVWAEVFTQLCRRHGPAAVFVGATDSGREFAPRFAARLNTGCTSDATELAYNAVSGDIEFIEPAVGGKLMAVITVPEQRPQVGTIRAGTFRYEPGGRRCEPEQVCESIDVDASTVRTRVLSFTPAEGDMGLAEAEVVVCVGNGLAGPERLGRYAELAELLGGKLACTRPLLDRGLMSFRQMIGQSGVSVKPKLYIGFGVSGAVNHVTGFAGSELSVAVNSDPDAAIFSACDYGIVGDMDEVCDALIAEIKRQRANAKASDAKK